MYGAILVVLIGAGVGVSLSEGRGPFGALLASLLVFAAFLQLRRAKVERILAFLRGVELLLPVVAAGITWIAMGTTAGTLRFDEVGAQVIIVLVLALAIDSRFFRLHRARDRLDIGIILYTMLLLGVGEYFALQGLVGGHPAHAELVAGAIAAGFTAVAISAMSGRLESTAPK